MTGLNSCLENRTADRRSLYAFPCSNVSLLVKKARMGRIPVPSLKWGKLVHQLESRVRLRARENHALCSRHSRPSVTMVNSKSGLSTKYYVQ